jgi:site-specific DNA-methyltransferase (adenine-specific)
MGNKRLKTKIRGLRLVHKTRLGSLFKGDCFKLLRSVANNSVDVVFADPPFNSAKQYQNGRSDKLSLPAYQNWSTKWLTECARILKPDGSLFVYHTPTHGIWIAQELQKLGLTVQAIIIHPRSDGAPLKNRLRNSYLVLLHFSKGQPSHFKKPRRPLACCYRCGQTHKHYGGHIDLLNQNGIDVGTIWDDIPVATVTKDKHRRQNQLHPWLLARVIDMTTEPGQVILDPFSGTGTTAAVAEIMGRCWMAVELGRIGPAKGRLKNLKRDRELVNSYLSRQEAGLLTEKDRKRMRKNGINESAFPHKPT